MDFRRLFDILPYQQVHYPNKIAIGNKRGETWEYFSTEECLLKIDNISIFLLSLGLKLNDKVAIIAEKNCIEWSLLDFALQQIGVIVVPIYPSISLPDYEFIINDATIKYCFTSTTNLYKKVQSIHDGCPFLIDIFCWEKSDEVQYWESNWADASDDQLANIHSIKSSIHEDDLVTIIYTSGTTGKPKGVMLSHKNIISNIKGISETIPINKDKKAFSFLPLSHIFERTVVYTYMANGMSVYYPDSPDNFFEDLKLIRPNYFTSVPRVLEKIYATIRERSLKKTNFFQRTIAAYAMKLGQQYKGQPMPLSFRFQHFFANTLVYRHWRKALGGKIEAIIVGAAAMPPNIAKLFSAAGIPIREGYGLTESSPVLTMNNLSENGVRFGTVGIPLPRVSIKIADDGEILAKGPNIMLGYYNQKALTDATIDSEGWLHTGDIGKFIENKFLKITGRKKAIFKTSHGKIIAPQFIEGHFTSQSLYIEQIMILGDNKAYVAGLIVPSVEGLKKWCDEKNIIWTELKVMLVHPQIIELFEQHIFKINAQLGRSEQVKKYVILSKIWSPEAGELTPTLKLKRAVIMEKYAQQIQRLY